MFCSKCGQKNEVNSKFCVFCGNSLTEGKNVKENKSDQEKNNSTVIPIGTGATRKALKKDAIEKPKGALIGAILIAALILGLGSALIFVLFAVITKSSFYTAGATSIISTVILIIGMVLISFGLEKASLKITRNEKLTFGAILKEFVTDFDRLGKYILIAIVYGLALTVVNVVPLLGGVAGIIAAVYCTPILYVYMLLQADKTKNYTIEDGIKYAFNITKGHKVEFYGLTFSFIGWELLCILTLGILYFYVGPYKMYSICNWYRRITGDATFKETKNGISDGAVIAIYVGVSIGIFVLLTILFTLGMLVFAMAFAY